MSIGEGTPGERVLEDRPAELTLAVSRPAGGLGTRSVLDHLPAKWRVIHERHWPGRSYDTVDHVVVGPSGIFIIGSVGWSGPVTITPDVLVVNARPRLTAVQAAHEAAREVALLLPPDLRDHCCPVICLTRDELVTGWVKAVRICSVATLADLLETRPPVLTDVQIVQIGAELDAALPPVEATTNERTRAADVALAAAQAATVARTTRHRPWYRSRAAHLVEAGLGLAVAASLGLVGARELIVDSPSDSGPATPHSVTTQQP